MPIVRFEDGNYLGGTHGDRVVVDGYLSTPASRAPRVSLDEALPHLRAGATILDPHDLTKRKTQA